MALSTLVSAIGAAGLIERPNDVCRPSARLCRVHPVTREEAGVTSGPSAAAAVPDQLSLDPRLRRRGGAQWPRGHTVRTTLLSLTVLVALVFVTACVDTRGRRTLTPDPEQQRCTPVPADMASTVPEAAPYYITIGLAQLESTAPRDDQGDSDNIYAFMRRQDMVVEARINDVVGRRRRAESRLDQLSEERVALVEAGSDTETIDEQIREGEEERARLAAEETELRQLVTGRTPTLARQGSDLLFNDWPMPFRVYAGDTVEVRIIERDPFQNDLLGHTEFVIDAAVLEAGHLELRTGWVESLSLGFAPCD